MNEESINDFGLYFIGESATERLDIWAFTPYSERDPGSRAYVNSGQIALSGSYNICADFRAYLPQVPPRLMDQSKEYDWYVEPDFSYVLGSEFEAVLRGDEYPLTTEDNVVFRMGYTRSSDTVYVFREPGDQPMSSNEIALKIVQKDVDTPPEFTVKDGTKYIFLPDAWIGVTSGLGYANADDTLQDAPTGFKFDPDTIRQLGTTEVVGTLNQFLSNGWATELITVPRLRLSQSGQDVSNAFFKFGKVEFED